ncbi:hypothetical protein KIN20_004751 [Parelaphostrongylus tenuis]|uniref:Uncharacterized protein n=1 Tax=Parelaphostrongylus tenuis TaxID=148309 RepID=A0AAD5MHR2_PARTN|nr:hypothetical protein KIN20_004751 [Parelaphostrongylus tenuis]
MVGTYEQRIGYAFYLHLMGTICWAWHLSVPSPPHTSSSITVIRETAMNYECHVKNHCFPSIRHRMFIARHHNPTSGTHQ